MVSDSYINLNNADHTKNIASKKLFELFLKYKDKPFLFVEPGGNHGDTLIYVGGFNLAKKAGLKFQAYQHKEFMALKVPEDSVIYFQGGGHWVPGWIELQIAKLLKAVNSNVSKVILGPLTLSSDINFLKNSLFLVLRQKKVKDVAIFARDALTYEILKEHASDYAEVYQDHDTAFNLSRSDLLPYETPGRYVLYGIRTDEEKTSLVMPSVWSFCFDPPFYCKNFEHWLYVHAYSKKIITNRMHSAILGSILGVPTTLLSNGYHKNRSVWEFSLKDRGVEWKEEMPSGELVRNLFQSPLIKKLILGNKFTYLKALFYGARYTDFQRYHQAAMPKSV